MINFNFPAAKFVVLNDSEIQLDHVLSEAVEVSNAKDQREEELEMVDLMHSSETYWRRKILEKGPAYVDQLIAETIAKNAARGYYTSPLTLHTSRG